MKLTLSLGTTFLVMTAAAPASASTLVNESFSNGLGAFAITTGAPIDVVSANPNYQNCCFAVGSAANLNNPFVVFGDGNRANTGSLSTSFATTAGQLYDLSFRYTVLGGGADSLRYTVGSLTGLVSGAADNNFDTTFRAFSTQFVGTGAPTTLSFSGVGAGINVDVGVDDVLVAAAVPEPATWALMVVGFGGIGFAMRHRKRNVTTTVAYA